MESNGRERLTSLYEAFNRRDIPALLAALTPDVAWPNGWEGGIVHGHDQVRLYWQRQWAEIDPQVTPTAFRTEEDGRVAVTVHQVVRSKEGTVINDQEVEHLYRFTGELIAGMEILDTDRRG